MTNIERSTSVDYAIQAALKEIRELGLDFSIKDIGRYIKTHICILYKNGDELTRGNGKGIDNQSKASALYEALEHFISENEVLDGSKKMKIQHVVEQSQAIRDEKVFELLMKSYPDYRVPVKEYFDLREEGNVIYYPSFLTNPSHCIDQPPDDLFYKNYSKYSSNNGTAIGCCKEEALVHSICELIERDAFSCFLLESFISRNPKPMKIVDKKRLPEKLEYLIDNVHSELERDFYILDITSDFQIPVFLCVMENKNLLPPYIGCGASLSPYYALERALLELVQVYHLYNEYYEVLKKEDELILKKFSTLKKYKNCVDFDISGGLFEKNNNIMININEEKINNDSLEDYLNILINKVTNNGFKIYANVLYSSKSDITCVNCIIPGLERFHLVRHGSLVLPSLRGRNILVNA